LDSGSPHVRAAPNGRLPKGISVQVSGTPALAYTRARRIVTCLMMSLVVWVTPAFKLSDGQFPVSFYLLCIFAYCLHQVRMRTARTLKFVQIASYSIFVGVMAFNAQISDPNVGTCACVCVHIDCSVQVART
jgi:hypothetical protein